MKSVFMPALLALIAMPVLGMAHVTANPDQGAAGSYFQSSFRVSHGCDGSATKAVRIKLPDHILVARPQFKPGWKAKVVMRTLDHAMPAGHGKMITKAPSEIIWTGGPLPDDQYDDFGVVVKLPEASGTTLWFPVTQDCLKGKKAWDEIPEDGQEWHALKSPAPFVKIISAP